MSELVFWSHLAVTWFLTGLIWTVQRVHYPYLSYTSGSSFVEAHTFHTRRIGELVVPLMLVEMAGAALLCWRIPHFVPPREAWIGLALVGIVWGSTALLQVPEHQTLGRGPDPAALRRLVLTNWVRTVAWTVRALLVLRWAIRA